jgi:hypothetical protein
VKRRRKKGAGLSPDAVDVVLSANLGNILRKAKAGKVLTAREEDILRRASATPKAAEAEDAKQWVTPAEFERHLAAVGLEVSHKNLYRTYLGNGARYAKAIPRSGDGRKIHRDRATEIVRMVQAKETDADPLNSLALRAAAEARLRTAQAERAEIMLAEMRRTKIDIAIVQRVWSRAVETFKAELRALSMALPDDLRDKTGPEIKAVLDTRFHDALRHLAVELGPKSEAGAT